MKRTMTLVLCLVLCASLVAAKPFSLPAHAVEVQENVYYLGQNQHNGKWVDGYAYVFKAKPDNPGGGKGGGNGNGGGGKDKGGSTCYQVLSKGAFWKTPETWLFNPTNPNNISTGTLFGLLENSIASWENEVTSDIFSGGVSTTATLVADEVATDGNNEVYFGSIADPNTIAVTITWGIFSGPPRGRELLEWDQIYSTSYNWATDGNAFSMDFQNIATHELGHALGLGHPGSECTEETMYAYASEGETSKRSLNAGDVSGAQSMYS